MAPPHHHYPQGGSTRIYVDENGYPVSSSQQPPDGSVALVERALEAADLLAAIVITNKDKLDVPFADQPELTPWMLSERNFRKAAAIRDEVKAALRELQHKTACEVSDG